MDNTREIAEKVVDSLRNNAHQLCGLWWDNPRYAEERELTLNAIQSVLDAELEAAIADRDMEWWRELALNDAVAPNPEEVKKWVIMERDLAVVEERQRIADMVTNGDYCRMVDHSQGFCGCEEMRADILRGPALIPLDDPEGENFEQIAEWREKSLGK